MVKNKGYLIGSFTTAIGVLVYLLMSLTVIQRTTITEATSRVVKYNGFEFINFNGISQLKIASILQIALMVFAGLTIIIGVLKLIETYKKKDFGLRTVCYVTLIAMAVIGIAIIFFAILYCKTSNKFADTNAYTIDYVVGAGPFLQVALTIFVFAFCDYIHRYTVETKEVEALQQTEGETYTERALGESEEQVVVTTEEKNEPEEKSAEVKEMKEQPVEQKPQVKKAGTKTTANKETASKPTASKQAATAGKKSGAQTGAKSPSKTANKK